MVENSVSQPYFLSDNEKTYFTSPFAVHDNGTINNNYAWHCWERTNP